MTIEYHNISERGLEPELQIGNVRQNKKTSQIARLPICYPKMVRECVATWNQIEASSVLMYKRLRDLGFTFDGEQVIPPSEVQQDV